MDTVLGNDSLLAFFTLKTNIFIVVTSVYLFLNFIACCCASKGKVHSSKKVCCKKKNDFSMNKLNES